MPTQLRIDDDVSGAGEPYVDPPPVAPPGVDPTMTPTEDGGAVLDFSEPDTVAPEQMLAGASWDANLADYLDDEVRRSLASDLLEQVEADDHSREDWKKTLKLGMEQMGLENEPRDDPFKGACGVTYPLIMEAAVRFQARAIVEMFPEGGPVEFRVLGEETEQTREQGERVRDYLNYLLTERDEGYFPDFDQMLLWLAIQGSMFRKVWRDPLSDMTLSRYLKPDDVIISYGAADEVTAPRLTHQVRYTENEIRKLQAKGFYRQVDLIPVTQEAEPGPMAEKANEIEGVEPPAHDKHARRLIYEVHTDLVLEQDPAKEVNGIASPYVVAIDKESQVVLSIRRGWKQGDPLRKRKEYFVHYRFFPGFGCYGYGYAHVASGHARAITAILRQLVDAGQFANLPAGIRAKSGLKADQNNVPFAPGEWREVDQVDPMRPVSNMLAPLPYKEPSAVLFQLMNGLIESGSRLTSLMDAEVGDGSTQQAVGTVMALLEQSLQVQSAIHKRMHRAQHKEFRLIAETERDHIPPEGYPYNIKGGNRKVMAQDFDDRIDVVPVSDPKSFTTVQRLAKAQFVLQTAGTAPQIHNARNIYKYVYDAAGIDDTDRLMAPEPPPPFTGDANSENMAAMSGVPLKVRADQDHVAHGDAHLYMLQVPGFMMSPPGQALFKHAVEHELWAIWADEAKNAASAKPRPDIAMQMAANGIPPPPPMQLPQPGQPMPPEIENAVSAKAAQAMANVVAKLKAMVPMPPGMTDPAMIQAQTNATEVQLKDQRENAKLVADQQQHNDEMQFDYVKLGVDQQRQQQQDAQRARDAAAGRVTTVLTAQQRAARPPA